MPNSIQGFTGSEIVARVINYIGSPNADLQTYLEQSLPLAEYRFCKMHDWRFLHKTNLSLAITNGTTQYELTDGTIGYYIAASDIESIYDETNGIYLKKVDLNQLRRLDPKSDSGSASDSPTMWAEVEDNKIQLWPTQFATGTLKIDGKITKSKLTTLSQYPIIPYKYQESFIDYVIAMGLDRDNDDRAPGKKQEAIALIQADIRDDMSNSGGNDEPRIKSMFEKQQDGVGVSDGWFWNND